MANTTDELEQVKDWAKAQLRTLVKVPAVRVVDDEVKPNATALLTLKMANEYKKLLQDESKQEEEDELLQILKGD